MAHSGRTRHRDRDAGLRQFDVAEVPAVDRRFRITDAKRQEIAAYLRQIDETRSALQNQHNAANRLLIRNLKAAADGIYDVINELEEIEG